ncbi:hypothetical protein AACH06_28910 [Ideonella sp. DXS29W]|uniref:Uncharacterized protein n=1 Tax=Ideonella lacteola TaxID=2984193 RepID=A0ABU9C2F2_9BURK
MEPSERLPANRLPPHQAAVAHGEAGSSYEQGRGGAGALPSGEKAHGSPRLAAQRQKMLALGGRESQAPIQAKWVTQDPLPTNAAHWENAGDGDAESGVYWKTSIENRWLRQGRQYVYDPQTGRLDKSDEFVVDMSGIDRLDNEQSVDNGLRKQLPSSDKAERPDLTRAQSLAASLFSESALRDGEVQDLILRVLGDGFVHWAKSGINDNSIAEGVDQVFDAKVNQLRKRYADIDLIDVIVIYGYSWYADKYTRQARVARLKEGSDDFGDWQGYANQLKTSLRKLRRFTGDKLYRCSRKGEEVEKIKKGGSWDATSFLSTTYSDEARDDLEKDDKYKSGSTLHMDASKVEGYHIEEFSQFEREHEVVLLPGHQVIGSNHPEQGRRVDAALSPPKDARPRTGLEPNSVEEFAELHRERRRTLPPPPTGFLPLTKK